MEQNDSYAATFRTPNCWLSAEAVRNWKPDHHRQFFCNKWGSLHPKFCPSQEARETCKGIHEPLKALDHFSIPPHINPPPLCKSKFRYMKTDFEQDPCSYNTAIKLPRSTSKLQGIPQLPQNYKATARPYGDSICGLYETTSSVIKNPYDCENGENGSGKPKFSYDLPFTVSLMDPNSGRKKKIIRPIGGVARCLHPSERHDLKSIYNLEMLDFYKMYPRDKIDLYRSPLTIDKRRKRATIPRNSEKDLVLPAGEPICVNATPIKWRSTKVINGGKGFEVYIPNPIIIG